jgi:hypothetical protein
MDTQSTQTEQVTTTIGAFWHWVDTPTTVALIFGLAGAIFLGIYILRRIRGQVPKKES